MEKVVSCCAGLDVHKEFVEACVRRIEPDGRLHQKTQRWPTMTADLLAMAGWLAAQGVTHVAMESTGVFWKPIFNILEDRFTVLLVNARHLKQVPGRKSTHTRNSCLASQYRRLAGRRGKKRALIAVGHSILVIYYHMMSRATAYADLGGDFFDRLEPHRLKRYYVQRLERLGYKVGGEPLFPVLTICAIVKRRKRDNACIQPRVADVFDA